MGVTVYVKELDGANRSGCQLGNKQFAQTLISEQLLIERLRYLVERTSHTRPNELPRWIRPDLSQ